MHTHIQHEQKQQQFTYSIRSSPARNVATSSAPAEKGNPLNLTTQSSWTKSALNGTKVHLIQLHNSNAYFTGWFSLTSFWIVWGSKKIWSDNNENHI